MENMDTDVRVYRVNENPAFTPDDHTIQSEKSAYNVCPTGSFS